MTAGLAAGLPGARPAGLAMTGLAMTGLPGTALPVAALAAGLAAGFAVDDFNNGFTMVLAPAFTGLAAGFLAAGFPFPDDFSTRALVLDTGFEASFVW